MTTPGPDVYQTAAQALSEHSRLTVARVTVADPGFRAVVDVAYRAGREDAAKAIEAAYGKAGNAYYRAALKKAIGLARCGQHPRTPGEDVTP